MAKWWQDQDAKRAYQQQLDAAKEHQRRGNNGSAAAARARAEDVKFQAQTRAREAGN